MSAEVLREAARLMRERAEDAAHAIGQTWRAESPAGGLHTLEWHDGDGWVNAFRCGPCEEWTEDDHRHGYVGGLEEPAQHIASWHPAVALAVADMLEAFATDWEISGAVASPINPVVAVARAYLGEGS